MKHTNHLSSANDCLQALAAQGVEPNGVSDDSRLIERGDLFIAYPGAHADGRLFIQDALERGACAVLWERSDFTWEADWQIPNFPIVGLRSLCGALAHAIYAQPSERLSLMAITGTNGKTTVSHWLAATHPRSCAMIGTLGAGFAGQMQPTGLTTPQATLIAHYLADFVNHDAQACAIEASSIGLSEGRLDGLRVDVAIFTNLSRDHLDYHGSMTRYAAAKERLFTAPRLRLAVLNLDDPFGRELAARTRAAKIIGYTQSDIAHDQQAVIRADEIEETMHGLRFRLCAPNGRARVETRLFGRYNLSNLLAVAAVLFDAGLSPQDIAQRFSSLQAPAGRLEQIGGYNEPLIVVDYAHTPDALENALKALRPVAQARGASLNVIFGCGGDRDQGKRPLMGEIAARLADHVLITSDNPRSENPLTIVAEIQAGAPQAEMILDRAQAISQSILNAHPAALILIAGKGHEEYQEICGIRIPFSDLDSARSALLKRKEKTHD